MGWPAKEKQIGGIKKAYEAVDLITLYFCSCDSKAQGSENFACVFGPIVYQGGEKKL